LRVAVQRTIYYIFFNILSIHAGILALNSHQCYANALSLIKIIVHWNMSTIEDGVLSSLKCLLENLIVASNDSVSNSAFLRNLITPLIC